MSSANKTERRNSKKLNQEKGSGRDTVGQSSASKNGQEKPADASHGQNAGIEGSNQKTLIL